MNWIALKFVYQDNIRVTVYAYDAHRLYMHCTTKHEAVVVQDTVKLNHVNSELHVYNPDN